MATSLLDALQTKDSFTTNGMSTNSSSLNHCVDLFFEIGAMRGQDKTRLINSFTKAFGENQLIAMRLLFWVRDIRGGAGERQIFKDILKYLATNYTETIRKNIDLIPEFGRFDDLFVFVGTPLEKDALKIITKAIGDGNSLASKWAPRLNTKNVEEKLNAIALRKHLGVSYGDYRKMLSKTSNTVEQLMCNKDWGKIEYDKLPSKAISNYMKAFSKNDFEGFKKYLDSVDKGESKINTGAIYPYDIIRNLKEGNVQGANAQWLALPNYMEDNHERVLPMVDVSPSMETLIGNNSNITCLDVSISLGLYISERNIGPFKDAFITFHESPSLEVLKGSLNDRYNQISSSSWGGSTNLESAFNLILNKAKESNVPKEEMPTMILILSDMEFDCATEDLFNPTAQEMINNMFLESGYQTPKIVYWNIQARSSKNKPVKFDENGTSLVSGLSPTILKNILSGNEMTPYFMMMSVVDSKRYSKIRV